MIDTVCVPQGAECAAVRRGLRQAGANLRVLPIPIGQAAVQQFLTQWQQSADFLNHRPCGILLLGLCGSLSPRHKLGEGVIYRSCELMAQNQKIESDPSLIEFINAKFSPPLPLVAALTSDRPITSSSEKASLAAGCGVEVVDMEAYPLLGWGRARGIPVAVVRLVSDAHDQSLPDLAAAIAPEGKLQPRKLTQKMLQSPLAALGLIQSSLVGLNRLRQVTRTLFSELKS